MKRLNDFKARQNIKACAIYPFLNVKLCVQKMLAKMRAWCYAGIREIKKMYKTI